MSDGMSDARAEHEIYVAVRFAVHRVRDLVTMKGSNHALFGERMPHGLVMKVNELIADLGWQFRLAQYAPPVYEHHAMVSYDAKCLWEAVSDLRKALRNLNIGHRGWAPCIDGEVDYTLTGSGYVLVRESREL